MGRAGFLILGHAMVGLGVVGAVLPLLPTTPIPHPRSGVLRTFLAPA